jgi:autotransporter-associated beta strand protein
LAGNTAGITLTKTGTGTLTYTGAAANTFNQLTTVSAGLLTLNKTAGVNAIAGAVTINSGGTLRLLASDQVSNTANVGIITINSGGTFDLNGNSDTLAALVFNTGGTFSQGGGVLTLSNTVASATTALTMGDATTITGDIGFTSTGGVLYNGVATIATVNGNVNLSTTAHVFNINNGAAAIDMEFGSTGVISGTGTITKSTGTGVLQFSGSNANTYTGLTTINAGELRLNKTAGVNAVGGSATINAGGTLSLQAADQIAAAGAVTISGGVFDMNTFPETIARLVFSSGTFSQTGSTPITAPTLTLQGAGNALTVGTVTISNTVKIALTGTGAIVNTAATSGTINADIDLGSSTHTVNVGAGGVLLIQGAISGAGGLSRAGTGQLTLAGTTANTYSGLTTLGAGTTVLNKTVGVTAIAGDILLNDNSAHLVWAASNQLLTSKTITDGGNIDMAGFDDTIGELIFNGGALITFVQGSVTAGTLSLNSPTTALSMQNATLPTSGILGTIAITNGGAVVFNGATGTAVINSALSLGGLTTPFNISDGSTAIDMSVTSVISNGAVTKLGLGTLEFTGAASNTYSGLTTVTAGTLSLNKTPGSNAFAGDVLINGGTLSLGATNQIPDTSNMTLSSGTFDMGGFAETINSLVFTGGTWNATGTTLTLASTGTALTMQNTTMTGGTVSLTGAGSFVVFDATNNGTANLNNVVLNAVTHTFNIANGSASTDMMVNGTLNGTGALIKQGAGSLALSGASSVGGLTTVSAGKLLVDGSLSGAGALTVSSGAILGGVGTISKACTISGTLAPGDSIGTIHLVGAQVMATGSTLEIEVNPITSDLVDVTGTFDVQNGATLALLFDAGDYEIPFSRTIVQTTGGRTGQFTSVTNSMPLFSPHVTYTALNIILTVGGDNFIPFSNLITKGNAAQVAHCLDVLPSPSGSDLAMVINDLRMLPTIAEVEAALLQMQPSAFTSLTLVQEETVLSIRNVIFNRLEAVAHSCLLNGDSPFSVWVAPFADTSKQRNQNGEPGYTVWTPGLLAGYAGALSRHVTLGGSVGYTYSYLHCEQLRGHAVMQGINGSVYAKWGTERGYLESALTGAGNLYQTSRHILFGTFPVIDRRATANHLGAESSFHLKGAYFFDVSNVVLSPFASVDYLFLYEGSFSEHGADSLNLSVQKKFSDLLNSEVGIDLSRCFLRPEFSLTPYLQLSALWEQRFLGSDEKSSLQGGCFMETVGLNPSRLLGSIAAGINGALPGKPPFLSLYYKGKFGSHFRDHSLVLQAMVNF